MCACHLNTIYPAWCIRSCSNQSGFTFDKFHDNQMSGKPLDSHIPLHHSITWLVKTWVVRCGQSSNVFYLSLIQQLKLFIATPIR